MNPPQIISQPAAGVAGHAFRRRLLPLAFLLAGLAGAYALGWQHYLSLDYLAASRASLKEIAAANPVAAPLGFALAYTAAVALSIPAATLLTLFAGFLFGWLFGGALVAVSATLGATLLFLAARSACGTFLRERVRGRSARLAEGFEANAFGYLLALRLAPVFPFFVVNIAPALFRVRPGTYVAATFLGILPATFVFTWLGTNIDGLLEGLRYGHPVTVADLVSPRVTLALVLLALLAAAPPLIRAFRSRRRQPGRRG